MQRSSSQVARRSLLQDKHADPVALRAMLQQHLRNALGRHPVVIDCAVANQRHRDGSRGTVQYEVRLQDPESGVSWDQIITGLSYGGERTSRVWDVIRAAQARQAATLAPESLLPFAFVPELDLLLQVFPHDHRLPALAWFMAPSPPATIARALVESFGPGSWQLRSWRPETIQYRPDMRAIVQIDLAATDASTGRDETRRFFAKIYRDADQAVTANQDQANLLRLIENSGSSLRVARPVHALEGTNTLVTGAVPGTSLTSIIRHSSDPEPAIRLAARAIADFHQLDAAAPARLIDEDVAQLRQAGAQLAATRPELAQLTTAMVDAIAAGLADAPMQLIHGDLKPEHILIGEDQVALIDFDLMCRADPVMDVAHVIAFLGSSDNPSGKRGRNSAARIFLDEYFTHAPPEGRSRLRLYHAVTSIHKALGLCRKDGARRDDPVASVLQEGQAILEGRVDDATPPSFKRRMTRTMTQ